MSKLYKVSNSSGKFKNIYAENENHAAELAIKSGLGRKLNSMKVKEYEITKHKAMEQSFLMLLECRNAIGEMKKNPIIKADHFANDERIMDYDGCIAVFKI